MPMGRYSAQTTRHGNNDPTEARMENLSTSKGAMNSSHVDGSSSLERRGLSFRTLEGTDDRGACDVIATVSGFPVRVT